MSDLTQVRWVPGFSWYQNMSDLMWPECVSSFCMTKTPMPLIGSSCFPDLNIIQNLWKIIYLNIQSCQVAPQLFQGRSLIPDPNLEEISPRTPPVISSGGCSVQYIVAFTTDLQIMQVGSVCNLNAPNGLIILVFIDHSYIILFLNKLHSV